MTVIPTVAATLQRADRDDIATTLLAARHASDLARGVTYDSHTEQVEQLRDRNPDHLDPWWTSGHRLDPADAATLALATIDDARSRRTRSQSGTCPDPAVR